MFAQCRDPFILRRQHRQDLRLAPNPLLHFVIEKRDIPHELITLQHHLHTHHKVREPARPARAREVVHHQEVVGQELGLRETVAGDPGGIVGMALLVAPEPLIGVGVVGDVAFC